MQQAVPDLVNSAQWPLAKALLFQLRMHNYTVDDEMDAHKELKRSKLNAVQIARDQIELLARVRCRACHGFAHTARHCHTHKKMQQALGATGIGNNRFALGYKQLVQEDARHNQPEEEELEALLLQVPAVQIGKRPRRQP